MVDFTCHSPYWLPRPAPRRSGLWLLASLSLLLILYFYAQRHRSSRGTHKEPSFFISFFLALVLRVLGAMGLGRTEVRFVCGKAF